MAITHCLGLPRIGFKRELKFAVEQYWQGSIDQDQLKTIGANIRQDNWQRQIQAGLDWLTVGDFSFYDQVLDLSATLGVVPERFASNLNEVDLDTYFRMARGRAPTGNDTLACEMTKWFDTNYHYIVPEFSPHQNFKLSFNKLFDEIVEAISLGKAVKPVLLGPLSYLWLGKAINKSFDKLTLLPQLQEVYLEILERLRQLQISWVQFDEPILVLDLPSDWQQAMLQTYQRFQLYQLNILLTTYFGGLGNNLELACRLPTAGLHIDAVRGASECQELIKHLPKHKVLSVGIVDGRNIWRTDLRKALSSLKEFKSVFGNNLWVSSSCSLLHCPVDLAGETALDEELKQNLAFATQKLREINTLATGLKEGEAAIAKALSESDQAVSVRKQSTRIHNPAVKSRCRNLSEAMVSRSVPYKERRPAQLPRLPLYPTTTIGSFPQTAEIREARQLFKKGQLADHEYRQQMHHHIAHAIEQQLALQIDVLVHGEAERNDMVEYFGELLEGFAFTQNGWVQSYGSRCVKPPIIFGDVSRPGAMTVEWIKYAQSLTDKPVKGMLTGPITILCWSFVRDDQPRFETAKQIALALRDEVDDLVAAGIEVIQIDEPAVREGLPLRHQDWEEYLQQAVYSFKLASCSAPKHVQIHTHMCYAEFNDIINAIAELDADVITIETSRSQMELLQAFEGFKYPNDIGPGVYDIHSPCIPSVEEITSLLERAAKYIPVERLWVNPDCGLKTRNWHETQLALQNMVQAANLMRQKYQKKSA